MKLRPRQPFHPRSLGQTARAIPVSYTHLDVYKRQIRAYARERNVACLVRTKNMDHGFVRMDKLRVQQILMNIMSNAVKFSHEGGTVELDIECRELSGGRACDKFVKMCIRDSWEADHFVACMKAEDYDCAGVEDKLAKFISGLHTDFEFVSRIGVYAVDDPELDVSLMCDRALLALKSTKDDYSRRTAVYNESMRAALIEEQEIVGEMDRALEKRLSLIHIYTKQRMIS